MAPAEDMFFAAGVDNRISMLRFIEDDPNAAVHVCFLNKIVRQTVFLLDPYHLPHNLF